MKTYDSICLGVPELLLPKSGLDLNKWAVIACDQYTSEPEYWQKVRKHVGDAPSTLHLIYPEAYFADQDKEQRIARIHQNMLNYLEHKLFEESEGFIYLERQVGRRVRRGVMVCLDLDQYDFRKESQSLIRATEGTILDRIPPRVKIREGALIELPHIMVLIDDPDNQVIGPLTRGKDGLAKIYDFDLMLGSGHLVGYRVDEPKLENSVVEGLKNLADPVNLSRKYGLPSSTSTLLYAMGDGNHSLATAKAIWEATKEKAQGKAAVMAWPSRYALVEIVNLHDEALVFEPIHRVLFDVVAGLDLDEELGSHFSPKYRLSRVADLDGMKKVIDGQTGIPHIIGLIDAKGFGVIEVPNPNTNLPLGTIQGFLDAFVEQGKAKEIDYIHGTKSLTQLGKRPGNLGLYLPAMKKQDLFKTVMLDGALPRKTFSMGEAREKRFYMEARRIESMD